MDFHIEAGTRKARKILCRTKERKRMFFQLSLVSFLPVDVFVRNAFTFQRLCKAKENFPVWRIMWENIWEHETVPPKKPGNSQTFLNKLRASHHFRFRFSRKRKKNVVLDSVKTKKPRKRKLKLNEIYKRAKQKSKIQLQNRN